MLLEMFAVRVALDDDEGIDIVFLAVRANIFIRSSRSKLASIILLASVLTK